MRMHTLQGVMYRWKNRGRERLVREERDGDELTQVRLVES